MNNYTGKGRVQKLIGCEANGYLIIDVYSTLSRNNKKVRKILLECTRCGQRLERGGSIDNIFTAKCSCRNVRKPPQKHYAKIEFNGELKSMSQLCREYKVNLRTFLDRINRGMSIEEALQKRFRHECELCGKEFYSKSIHKKYCSKTCEHRKYQGKGPALLYVKQCEYCGQVFFTNIPNQNTCSAHCRNKTSVLRRTGRYKDLKEKGLFDYSVTIRDVFNRYNGICQCCGQKLNFKVSKNSDKRPSIDHVIPLSKGGTHTWDNVQLLCRKCNIAKGDKIAE